jgi:hypothetical protein
VSRSLIPDDSPKNLRRSLGRCALRKPCVCLRLSQSSKDKVCGFRSLRRGVHNPPRLATELLDPRCDVRSGIPDCGSRNASLRRKEGRAAFCDQLLKRVIVAPESNGIDDPLPIEPVARASRMGHLVKERGVILGRRVEVLAPGYLDGIEAG